jgi:phospholipase/carboxylesterase
MAEKDGYEEGRLRARPAAQPIGEATVGLRPLGIDAHPRRDHLLYVPVSYRAGRPSPLMVLLHGAGSSSRDILPHLREVADAAGLILLAPTSREYTWDVIVGGYGPDVAAVDRALEEAFSRCAVDPARVAVGGFSDGASYALSLGITNGACRARARVLAGVHGAGGARGFPAHLRLPRHQRRGAPDRPLQPQDRPPARARRL